MEFSQNVIEIFDDLCERIGIAIDWSAENIMPYIKDLFERFIRFEIGTSIFYIVLSIFVLSIALSNIPTPFIYKNNYIQNQFFLYLFHIKFYLKTHKFLAHQLIKYLHPH